MREEPAADDQDAFVAERGELAADVHQLTGVERGQRQLKDGDVGVGVHLDERDVRAVVQSAVRVLVDRAAEQLADDSASAGAPGAAYVTS